MTLITSHVLDTVRGDHAGGIRVQCFLILPSNERPLLFDVIGDAEGRIKEPVEVDVGQEIELCFHAAAYFQAQGISHSVSQVMPKIWLRLIVPSAAERIHIPMMLSPHQYSVWWSGGGS